MPKGNKPAARAIEWLCLIIGHLTLRNFKSMPESPFQIWSQWAENLTNCELLNEKPRLDGHPDGARGPSNGALAGAPFVPASWHLMAPRPQLTPGWGPFLCSQINANLLGSADCEGTIGIVPNCGTLPYLNFGLSSLPSWGRFFLLLGLNVRRSWTRVRPRARFINLG